jgi:hypothetical protein
MNLDFKCKNCPKRCDKCKELAKAERNKPFDGRTHHIKSDSLCWCCKKAVEGGCNWIDTATPVNHWDADLIHHSTFTAYHVNDCPEFERG